MNAVEKKKYFQLLTIFLLFSGRFSFQQPSAVSLTSPKKRAPVSDIALALA